MSRLPDDFALSNLSRRGFLKGVGAASALVVAASWGWQDAFAEEAQKKFGADGMPTAGSTIPRFM
jgi:isoquinoline 1-oxidoreductase beta subunit